MARLFCTEDGANKFWEGTALGATLIVRFGKVGTAGQEKKKTLASAAAAEAELAKLTAEKRRKGYREGPDDPAAPPPTEEADPYPFRFYGRRPADWFEGAHALEIRVSSDLAPAAKVLADKLGRGGLPGHAAVASAPGVMRLDLVDPDRTERFFDAVEELLRAIHEVVPLREVVLLSQRAPGKHAWDVWSREQGAPAPGPVYADWKKPVAGEVRDPSLPVPKRDATLEHAVTAAQDAAQSAKAASSAAKAVAAGQPAAVLVRDKTAPALHEARPTASTASGGSGAVLSRTRTAAG
jgi:predicted DNA-binding WGR domain protein